VKFQFPSKRWEIEILLLIKESFKTFPYFLYHLHPLYYLKVSEISFPNSRLFPHADDPLFQETVSELVKYRSSVDIGGYVELYPIATGATIAIHHMAEVFDNAESLGHALRCWLNVVVGCSGIRRRVPVLLRLSMSYFSLWKHTNHIFSSLCIYFLSPSQF